MNREKDLRFMHKHGITREYIMAVTCECPVCGAEVELQGYKENEFIDCPECGESLEIVSLTPPVLEQVPEEEDD